MHVRQFYNKNQFVIHGNGETVFQSYNSTIASIKNGVLTLGDDWDYSRTTLKHLYLFINDYINDIYNEKNTAQYKALLDLDYKSNKRAFIQSLIDKKIIKVKDI